MFLSLRDGQGFTYRYYYRQLSSHQIAGPPSQGSFLVHFLLSEGFISFSHQGCENPSEPSLFFSFTFFSLFSWELTYDRSFSRLVLFVFVLLLRSSSLTYESFYFFVSCSYYFFRKSTYVCFTTCRLIVFVSILTYRSASPHSSYYDRLIIFYRTQCQYVEQVRSAFYLFRSRLPTSTLIIVLRNNSFRELLLHKIIKVLDLSIKLRIKLISSLRSLI